MSAWAARCRTATASASTRERARRGPAGARSAEWTGEADGVPGEVPADGVAYVTGDACSARTRERMTCGMAASTGESVRSGAAECGRARAGSS